MSILTVDVRDVEYGDCLYPMHVPIGAIVLAFRHGRMGWAFGNDRGMPMCWREDGTRVQVWRGDDHQLDHAARVVAAAHATVAQDRGGSAPPVPAAPRTPSPVVAGSGNVPGGRGAVHTSTGTDDCPPHGITRRHGLWQVTP